MRAEEFLFKLHQAFRAAYPDNSDPDGISMALYRVVEFGTLEDKEKLAGVLGWRRPGC